MQKKRHLATLQILGYKEKILGMFADSIKRNIIIFHWIFHLAETSRSQKLFYYEISFNGF